MQRNVHSFTYTVTIRYTATSKQN